MEGTVTLSIKDYEELIENSKKLRIVQKELEKDLKHRLLFVQYCCAELKRLGLDLQYIDTNIDLKMPIEIQVLKQVDVTRIHKEYSSYGVIVRNSNKGFLLKE